MRPVVLGVGEVNRADDAVGPLVAAAVADAAPEDVDVHSLRDPVRLPDLWQGRPLAVVVDAAVGAGAPGTMRLDDVTASPLPVLTTSATSTHGVSLATVVELSRGLGTLPRRLLVLTVAGSVFTLGQAPQPAVRDAVGPATERVLQLLRA